MIKKTITYTDYNGTQRTEDFYFNLTKAELVEMELTTDGGLAEMIQNIVNAKDQAAIIKVFKDLLYKAYGVKSPDGKRFMKSPELTAAFVETEAYSELFMELATNDAMASEFVKGIVPANMSEQPKALPAK
jgi:hypothetical protein